MNLFHRVITIPAVSLALGSGFAFAQDSNNHDNRPQNAQQGNYQNRQDGNRPAPGQQGNVQGRPSGNQPGYTGQQGNTQTRPGGQPGYNGQQGSYQGRPGDNHSGYNGQPGTPQNRPGDNHSGFNGQYSGNQGHSDNHFGPGGPGQPGGGYAQNGYVRHNDWQRGHRMAPSDWNRGQRVDYRQYHLSAPPRGYEWRQVDGNYVLAAVTTGIIASVVAASLAR